MKKIPAKVEFFLESSNDFRDVFRGRQSNTDDSLLRITHFGRSCSKKNRAGLGLQEGLDLQEGNRVYNRIMSD
jgi:hypothetical protein